MAFVQLDSWSMEHAPAEGFARLWTLPVRRLAASSATILVHIGLLYVLIARLADAAAAETPSQPRPLALYDLGSPGASAPAPAPRSAVAPAAAAPTLVDLSSPADLPPVEWSMSAMRVARPAEPGGATEAGAVGAGSGRGGGPRLSEFVGFGDGIGGELLLDEPMLEAARRAAVEAVPSARGTALVFLRVAPTGVVTEAVIRGGGREMATALRRQLLGKKLFLVKSRIRESALVALPPLALGSA